MSTAGKCLGEVEGAGMTEDSQPTTATLVAAIPKRAACLPTGFLPYLGQAGRDLCATFGPPAIRSPVSALRFPWVAAAGAAAPPAGAETRSDRSRSAAHPPPALRSPPRVWRRSAAEMPCDLRRPSESAGQPGALANRFHKKGVLLR